MEFDRISFYHWRLGRLSFQAQKEGPDAVLHSLGPRKFPHSFSTKEMQQVEAQAAGFASQEQLQAHLAAVLQGQQQLQAQLAAVQQGQQQLQAQLDASEQRARARASNLFARMVVGELIPLHTNANAPPPGFPNTRGDLDGLSAQAVAALLQVCWCACKHPCTCMCVLHTLEESWIMECTSLTTG